MKVILKDGTLIAGKYAGNSFASSAPADEQLYLEETWILNDKFRVPDLKMNWPR